MSITTLFRFLVGSRSAIRRVAATPAALWVGLLFVLSAGLAREYDNESLVHEPWHLLLPLAVSLGSSFVLFGLFYLLPLYGDQPRPRFWSAYRAFLHTYWMTAPMAWLYALPWDRVLDAPDAVAMNLWTLALVSVWRVLLITRVISILFNCRAPVAFSLVMLYADVAVLIALQFLPLPIINIMGGIRLSESEQLISGIAFNTMMLGVVSLPVWIMGSLFTWSALRPSWAVKPKTTERSSWVVGSAGWLGVALIAFGLALLPFTQPEQMRRHTAERLLRSGEMEAAIDYLSRFERQDVPPHWDPPPRQAYGERTPELTVVVAIIRERNDVPPWLRERYIHKVEQALRHGLHHVLYRREPWPEVLRLIREEDRPVHLSNADAKIVLAEQLIALDDSLTDHEQVAIRSIVDILKQEVTAEAQGRAARGRNTEDEQDAADE